MPHDKNGQPLNVGDEVLIRGTVTAVWANDDFSNVHIETTERMYPGDHKSAITLNARQVEKYFLHEVVIDAAALNQG